MEFLRYAVITVAFFAGCYLIVTRVSGCIDCLQQGGMPVRGFGGFSYDCKR